MVTRKRNPTKILWLLKVNICFPRVFVVQLIPAGSVGLVCSQCARLWLRAASGASCVSHPVCGHSTLHWTCTSFTDGDAPGANLFVTHL